MHKQENLQIFFHGQEKVSLLDAPRRLQLRIWIEKHITVTNGRALDVGCWNGDFLRLLSDHWEKWGLDLERHPDLPEEVKFVVSDLEQPFPVADNYFDLVFAGEIIEHVRATTVFLERCCRALKPGGWLMLTTPNLSCWLNLWRWLTLGQPWCVDSDVGQSGHVRYLAPRTLKEFLLKVGFEIQEMVAVGGLEFLKRYSNLAYRFLFKIFPLRGKNLMVLARKLAGNQ